MEKVPISNDIVAEYKDKAFHREGCCEAGQTICTTARQMVWSKIFADSHIRHRCLECGICLEWERGLPVISINEARMALAVCELICRESAMEPYASSICGSFAKAEICGATGQDILIRVSYGIADGFQKCVSRRTERLPRNLITAIKTAEEALPFMICDSEQEHEEVTVADLDEH